MIRFVDGIKAKICNKCKVYITLKEDYHSNAKEKAFDRNHNGHPRITCMLSEIQNEQGLASEDEKYKS